MKAPFVDAVRLQPLQASLQKLPGAVAGAVVRFGCDPHLTAAMLQYEAKPLFGLPVGVARRRIEVGDALVDGTVNDANRFFFRAAVFVHYALRAEAEERKPSSGRSEIPLFQAYSLLQLF